MSDREKVMSMICNNHKLNKNTVEQVLLNKAEFMKYISNNNIKHSRITLKNYNYYYVVDLEKNIIYFSSF